MGAYGYAAAETPALDGLARRGARFERAQSPVPITGPSHATILTGQYPPVHGVRDNVVFTLGAAHPTLAAILKKQGYRTGAFVGAIPVAAGYGFGQGFDVFDEDLHETPAGAQGAERPANEVADKAVAWLGRRPRRRFSPGCTSTTRTLRTRRRRRTTRGLPSAPTTARWRSRTRSSAASSRRSPRPAASATRSWR